MKSFQAASASLGLGRERPARVGAVVAVDPLGHPLRRPVDHRAAPRSPRCAAPRINGSTLEKSMSPSFSVGSSAPHGITNRIDPDLALCHPVEVRRRRAASAARRRRTSLRRRGRARSGSVVSVESEHPTAPIASRQTSASAPRTALIGARLAIAAAVSAGHLRKRRQMPALVPRPRKVIRTGAPGAQSAASRTARRATSTSRRSRSAARRRSVEQVAEGLAQALGLAPRVHGSAGSAGPPTPSRPR